MSEVIRCDVCETIIDTTQMKYAYYSIELNLGQAIVFGDQTHLPGLVGKTTADCCSAACVARAVGIDPGVWKGEG